MKNTPALLLALSLCLLPATRAQEAAAAPALPREWVDPDTGHRVVQLSTEPGSACLYFTQYAYTAGGTKMVMTTPHGIELVTLATGEIEHLHDNRDVRRRIDSNVLQTGRKSGLIYYQDAGVLYSLDPATKESRAVATAPANGTFSCVNADETLAAGTTVVGMQPELSQQEESKSAYTPGSGVQKGDIDTPVKHARMDRRLAARLPMTLFTVNLQTGEVKVLLHSTDWLNHLQFSPTDPSLLMYAHEGRQWKVDRIWLIRADGQSQPMLVHQRTMKMEIAVHEFWSSDGQWIWYDLQTPLSEDFWLGGYNVVTGKRLWYHVPSNLWQVHYNASPDGTLFAGDGSDPDMHYAHAQNAKFMFLLRPELIPDMPGETPDQANMIQVGKFTPERLVNLAQHDYSLEPNGNFTPDGKWLIFRSNMRGPIEVYAVEVAKAQ
jgi:oligogalacturonide lyase